MYCYMRHSLTTADHCNENVFSLSPLQPGALLGEMAVWKDDSIRMACIEGGEPGLIATMLKAGINYIKLQENALTACVSVSITLP